MIVYVETNYLLELTYLQEHHGTCEDILLLGEADNISMVLPAFCAIEGRMALLAKGERRTKLNAKISDVVREFARSEPYKDIRDKSRDLAFAMAASIDEDLRRLEGVLDRVLSCAEIEPLSESAITTARKYENVYKLSPQDAAVLASVVQHAQRFTDQDKCFLNRDKHFADPDIHELLAKHKCTIYANFDEAYNKEMKPKRS